jgi:uncharacterized protein
MADHLVGAVIDGLRFAREGGHLAGTVPVAALSRLADQLADAPDPAEVLACELCGERGGDGKAYLRLRVSGSLDLRCQRCLEPLTQSVDIESCLLLVPPGQDWPDEELVEDGFDAVAAEREMALLPLIEDEVLLALPIAPRHSVCGTAARQVVDRDSSPFAVLAKLKKGV